MNEQQCVRGTRLTVKRVLHVLHIFAENPDREEIMKDYPRLDEEDIRQVLQLRRSQAGGRPSVTRTSRSTLPRLRRAAWSSVQHFHQIRDVAFERVREAQENGHARQHQTTLEVA